MQLTLWTYEGPAHVGAMRIAASMRGVHYVLHAPQGDTYADLLFTMIERFDHRPPVSYTTFQGRDLGGETASLAVKAVADAYERFQPDLLLVGESCTGELLQDQAGNLAATAGLPIPVVPLELNSYAKRENWAAAETLYRLVRTVLAGHPRAEPAAPGRRPRANLLGPTALGFRCRDDVVEVTRVLDQLGIEVNAVVPLGASVADVRRLPDADLNIDLYPEVSRPTARWLNKEYGMPSTTIVPMGPSATRAFVAEVCALLKIPSVSDGAAAGAARADWYARSVDSTYLTGKTAFVFGDATHAMAAARFAVETMGLRIVGLGTYTREFAREVREQAQAYGIDALITDDYLEVERAVTAAAPDLVLGTQMERHIAKRLGIACTVISTPIHVQDVPARYSPVMGREGANVLFDSVLHPLTMGLEEHLLHMFRDDFEFHDAAPASHLPAVGRRHEPMATPTPTSAAESSDRVVVEAAQPIALPVEAQARPAATAPLGGPQWTEDSERELRRIPFFVRAKARRNTERFAAERGIAPITVETLYEAKAHFGR